MLKHNLPGFPSLLTPRAFSAEIERWAAIAATQGVDRVEYRASADEPPLQAILAGHVHQGDADQDRENALARQYQHGNPGQHEHHAESVFGHPPRGGQHGVLRGSGARGASARRSSRPATAPRRSAPAPARPGTWLRTGRTTIPRARRAISATKTRLGPHLSPLATITRSTLWSAAGTAGRRSRRKIGRRLRRPGGPSRPAPTTSSPRKGTDSLRRRLAVGRSPTIRSHEAPRAAAVDALDDQHFALRQRRPPALLPDARTVGQTPEVQHVDDEQARRCARPRALRGSPARPSPCPGPAPANCPRRRPRRTARPARSAGRTRAPPSAGPAGSPKLARARSIIAGLRSAPSTRSPQEWNIAACRPVPQATSTTLRHADAARTAGDRTAPRGPAASASRSSPRRRRSGPLSERECRPWDCRLQRGGSGDMVAAAAGGNQE